MRPETTGETENGKSISVTRKLLPTKLNFPIAQAAATPKIRFRGTAMPAAISVKRIAASASGSRKLAKYTETPLASAEAKTTAKGMNRNTPRNKAAIVISDQLTNTPSVVACAALEGAAEPIFRNVKVVAISYLSLTERNIHAVHAGFCSHPAAAPGLQQVDCQQQHKRCDQHDYGNGGRSCIIVLLQFGNDQQWSDLCTHRHIAGDEYYRSVFADGAGERHSQ